MVSLIGTSKIFHSRHGSEISKLSWTLSTSNRFALLGISQGGPVSVAYAVRHPERVTHLILYGAYARGWGKRGEEQDLIRRQALLTLTRHGWGKDIPAYRQTWTSIFMPEATLGQWRWFNELQRASTSADNAARFLEEFGKIDVRDELPQVTAPTLVLHCRDDAVSPFEEGRLLATLVPGARFVPLEGKNHLPQEGDPCWKALIAEIQRFLDSGDDAAADVRARLVVPKSVFVDRPDGALIPREREVAELVARGLSNRQIAEALVITERTAESHVQHILDKLGLTSRSQIAAWAVDRGLHKLSHD